MTRLALSAVSVSLGGRRVVEELSLTVAAGTWSALIGPNGAGKTTTLRAVAGLVPHRGQITLDGSDAAALGRRERARHIAVVPQLPATPAGMTVADYVLLGRTPHLPYLGRESRTDRAAARRAIDRLELGGFARRPLVTLSGGERQRAVLARALAQEAGVLLLDEPTSAHDLARQQQVLELVDSLRCEDGLTVLAAMHDLTAVALYADHVHLLSGGRLVATGPAEEVLRAATLSEHFGTPVRVIAHEGELIVAPARAVSVASEKPWRPASVSRRRIRSSRAAK
jgi:iron complex transport system ATP-binding protein